MMRKEKERKQTLTWDDITIRQYMDIMKVLSDESRKDEVKALDIIPIIWSEIDPESIPMGEAINYISEANKLLQMPLESKKEALPKDFFFGGFGKCVITSIDKMTLSQFMDFQTVSSNPSNEHIAELLSICLVPVGNKYNNGYDIVELRTEVEKLPITVAPAILDFFEERSRKLLTRLKISLGVMMATNKEMTLRQRIQAIRRLGDMMDLLA